METHVQAHVCLLATHGARVWRKIALAIKKRSANRQENMKCEPKMMANSSKNTGKKKNNKILRNRDKKLPHHLKFIRSWAGQGSVC